MMGLTNSDYAGDWDDIKSTSGFLFTLGSNVISWSLMKHPSVTLSTTEAEFAAATCASQAIWLRKLPEEVNCKQSYATPIYYDNSSTIKVSKNLVFHGRSKHKDVRYHFLRDLTNDGIIELHYCTSQDQVVDIFTKALKKESFLQFKRILGIYSFE